MSKALDQLVSVVIAIKEDPKLNDLFVRVLELGSATQQVRVNHLRLELEKINAPEEILSFLHLLRNDQIAQKVLQELKA
ncbi:MAG: hypothetical protein ACK5WZ_03175 [Pseudobdellovibrionaceae bacterium]